MTSAPTSTVTITLTQNDVRFVLEALQMLENKWLEINRTSTDENEQAEYGMDALDLDGTREFSNAKLSKRSDRMLPTFRLSRLPLSL